MIESFQHQAERLITERDGLRAELLEAQTACNKLSALNEELVAALAGMIDYGDSEQPDLRADAHIQARAALARAKGTQ